MIRWEGQQVQFHEENRHLQQNLSSLNRAGGNGASGNGASWGSLVPRNIM